MNRITTITAFAVVFAAALGIGMASTTSGLFATPLAVSATDVTAESNTFLGHVTLTARDADGTIIAYRQSDNVIVNEGENCVAETIFQDNLGTSCSGAGTGVNTTGVGGFTIIRIGTGTEGAGAEAETDTDADIEGTVYGIQDTALGLTESTGTAAGSVATVVVDATFTAPGAADYDESSLGDSFRDVADGNMFAHQTFATITLGASDDLTVEWTITIGADS